MSITFTRRTLAACALTGGVAAASLLAATPAMATEQHSTAAQYSTTANVTSAAAGWLSTQFAGKSDLPQPGGNHFVEDVYDGVTYLNYGENADAIFGLAAAKSGSGAISAAISYLSQQVDAYSDVSNSDGYGPYDGAVAKTALAAIVAGRNPAAFGGYNLLATLKNDECAATATTCAPGSAANIYSSTSESFVILAEARGPRAYAPSSAALNYFLSLQCADGGFTGSTSSCGSGTADVDATSYAIMALQAAGGQSTALRKAVSWLRSQEQNGSYWGDANTNSTGLAAAALAAQGVNVTSAQAWLRSQAIGAGQPGAGAISFGGTFSPSTLQGTSPSVLATAQALTGLVQGGSLATVKAEGSSAAVALRAPAVSAPTTTTPAQTFSVAAAGFVAGEKVRVTINPSSASVGAGKVAADGTATISAKTAPTTKVRTYSLLVTGVTSGLTARSTITVAAP